jgi:beta-galactosidase beta subunit
MIGVLLVGRLAVAAPSHPAKDITSRPMSPRYFALTIPPGHIAVFFPDGWHLPLCFAGGPHGLDKVVVKVKVSRWEAHRKR